MATTPVFARPQCTTNLMRVGQVDAPGNAEIGPFGSYSFGAALLDPTQKFVYFGVVVNDGENPRLNKIFRVRVSDRAIDWSIDLEGQEWFEFAGGFIDEENAQAYFVGYLTHAELIRLDLNTLEISGRLDLDFSGNKVPVSAIFDPVTRRGYIGMEEADGTPSVYRLNPDTFLVDGVLDLPATDPGIHTVGLDSSEGYLYFSGWDFGIPAHIIKINVRNFTRVGSLVFDGSPRSMVIDPKNNSAFIVTSSGATQRILRVNLDTLSETGSISLNPDEFTNDKTPALLDDDLCSVNFGVDVDFPRKGRIVRIDRQRFVRTGTLDLPDGEFGLQTGVIHPATGQAFIGAHYGPRGVFGRVVELNLAPGPIPAIAEPLP